VGRNEEEQEKETYSPTTAAAASANHVWRQMADESQMGGRSQNKGLPDMEGPWVGHRFVAKWQSAR
jgi:hypothetical protein